MMQKKAEAEELGLIKNDCRTGLKRHDAEKDAWFMNDVQNETLCCHAVTWSVCVTHSPPPPPRMTYRTEPFAVMQLRGQVVSHTATPPPPLPLPVQKWLQSRVWGLGRDDEAVLTPSWTDAWAELRWDWLKSWISSLSQ